MSAKKTKKVIGKQPKLKDKIRNVQRKEERALAEISEVSEEVSSLIDTLTGQTGYLDNHKLTNYQLERLTKVIGILGGGYFRSIALICNENCTLLSRCPLAIIHSDNHGTINWDNMPADRRLECPVEHEILTTLENQYLTAYADRQTVSVEEVRSDPFIYGLIGELAETYVLEARINTRLAEDGGSLLAEEAIGINNEGEIATHLKESPLFGVKQKLKRTRDGLLKRLLLTPEMELKKKVANRIADPSTRQSAAMKEALKYMKEDEDGVFKEVNGEALKDT